MRLIEKLARDYANKFPSTSSDGGESAYIDGFCAARDLAADALADFTLTVTTECRLMTPGYGVDRHVSKSPLSDMMRQLGEKEIKE